MEPLDRGPRNRFSANHFRSRPDHSYSGRKHQSARYSSKSQVSAGFISCAAERPQRQSAQCQHRAAPNSSAPLPCARQYKPCKYPSGKNHGQPRRAVKSSTGEKAFRSIGNARQHHPAAPGAGQCATGLPRARRDNAISGIAAARFIPHRYDRHIAHGSSPDRPGQCQVAQSEQELIGHGKRKQRERR